MQMTTDKQDYSEQYSSGCLNELTTSRRLRENTPERRTAVQELDDNTSQENLSVFAFET